MEMKLNGLSFALMAASALGASAAMAEIPDPIRIATEGVYPPFNYVENGELTGFDVDIAKALCDQMKATCTIVTQDWDGMIPGLLAAKYDAIIASMNITAERKEKIDFTKKYYNTPVKFMALKENGITDISPAALAGKSIGVQGSTTQANFLEAKYPDSDIRTYSVVDDASADLQAGRIDFVLSDKVLLDAWIKASGEDCCDLVGEDLYDPIFGEGKGIGVRKEDTELRDAFQKALDEILANGTYEKVNAKYFPFSVY
jgi:polar amino acid transport system substrate-binding protein